MQADSSLNAPGFAQGSMPAFALMMIHAHLVITDPVAFLANFTKCTPHSLGIVRQVWQKQYHCRHSLTAASRHTDTAASRHTLTAARCHTGTAASTGTPCIYLGQRGGGGSWGGSGSGRQERRDPSRSEGGLHEGQCPSGVGHCL